MAQRTERVFFHRPGVHVHLIGMHPYLEQTQAIITDAIGGMTDEQLSAPREGKWSAAQIVEHLALAFGATAAGMERNLAAASLEVRKPTMRERVATFAVVGLGYIPTGRKAPEYTVPSGLSPQDALFKLRENLCIMDAAITRAEQKWGARLIGVHPILGPLKPDQWRKFHFVHARHHARQIVAIKSSAAEAPLAQKRSA